MKIIAGNPRSPFRSREPPNFGACQSIVVRILERALMRPHPVVQLRTLRGLGESSSLEKPRDCTPVPCLVNLKFPAGQGFRSLAPSRAQSFAHHLQECAFPDECGVAVQFDGTYFCRCFSACRSGSVPDDAAAASTTSSSAFQTRACTRAISLPTAACEPLGHSCPFALSPGDLGPNINSPR